MLPGSKLPLFPSIFRGGSYISPIIGGFEKTTCSKNSRQRVGPGTGSCYLVFGERFMVMEEIKIILVG